MGEVTLVASNYYVANGIQVIEIKSSNNELQGKGVCKLVY